MDSYGVVFVTVASESEGDAIAQGLLEAKLAACISMTQIKSMYRWQGKIENDTEWQLMIKTDLSQFAALEAKIKEMHSYDVPEIIALPIMAGSESYLSWISENVGY
ncbi:MAG: divalent-cation tolerance protein CutA [Spirulinaceae cyanobacterium]